MNPTSEQWGAYEQAYHYFNEKLFGGQLSPCILNFSRASKKTYGFFWNDKWAKGDDFKPEISLNPDHLSRSLIEVMATLAHEQTHQWQYEFGKPSRNGYHNKEWARKMKEIGLYPSHTGKPGGKETGQSMTHYVISDGPFDKAFREMPEAYKIPWTSGSVLKPQNPKERNKLKYTCPNCKMAAWGKPNLPLFCMVCDEQLECEIPSLTPYVEIDAEGNKVVLTGSEALAILKCSQAVEATT